MSVSVQSWAKKAMAGTRKVKGKAIRTYWPALKVNLAIRVTVSTMDSYMSTERLCLYCGNPTGKVRKGEHLIPDAIGGTLATKDVCGKCNNELSEYGSGVVLAITAFAGCRGMRSTAT